MKTVRALPLLSIVAVCAAPACATTAYQGPARPRGESATLATVDVAIEEIDGHEVEPIRTRGLQFSLPPGPHVVWLRVHKTSPWWGTPTRTSGHVEICLDAKAGAHYLVKGAIAPSTPDGTVTVVENRVSHVETDCRQARLFPDAPPTARSPTPDVPPPAIGDVSAIDLELPPPPLPPSGAPEVVARWRGQALWRPPAVPVLDVILNVRGRFAAYPANLTRVPEGVTRHAVSGISAGLLLTPLWLFRDRLGVGAGGDLELKFLRSATPDTSLPFWRMPATATVHILIRTHDDWFVLLAGGLQSQPVPRVAGSVAAGTVTRSYTSDVGWVAQLGAYRRLSDVVAMTTALGYTHLNYGGVDVSTFSVWLGLHASMRRPLREWDVPRPDGP